MKTQAQPAQNLWKCLFPHRAPCRRFYRLSFKLDAKLHGLAVFKGWRVRLRVHFDAAFSWRCGAGALRIRFEKAS